MLIAQTIFCLIITGATLSLARKNFTLRSEAREAQEIISRIIEAIDQLTNKVNQVFCWLVPSEPARLIITLGLVIVACGLVAN